MRSFLYRRRLVRGAILKLLSARQGAEAIDWRGQSRTFLCRVSYKLGCNRKF